MKNSLMEKTNNHYEKLIKTFESMCGKYSSHSLFCDFLELCAIAIQNQYMKEIDLETFEKAEQRYFEIIKNYEKEDLENIAKMLGYLTAEAIYRMENGRVSDILGEMFHRLELHNKYKGQFFTPQHICDFMAAITLSTNYKNDTREKGYIKVAEPCCGSGAMIFGAVKAFTDAGGDYKTQFMVVATDIDVKCTWMTFIQCSLYGIPAIINHGNTLTMEMYSTFYTLSFLTQDWEAKKETPLTLEFADYNKLQEMLSIF